MRTTIDQAGRVVIPKSIRDRLGLAAGTEIEVLEQDGHVHIAAVGPVATVDRSGARPVFRVSEPAPQLTDDDVRAVLDEIRGERIANR